MTIDELRGTRTERLKALLHNSGVSVAELSRRIGCTRQAIYSLLDGTNTIGEKAVFRIANVIPDCNPLWLLGIDFVTQDESKPVLHQKQCETRPLAFQMFGFCPACRQQLSQQEYPCYCGFCGQAVKWNGLD